MAKKKAKQTPRAYAEQLYMANDCGDGVNAMSDRAIINCRIRAFLDGASWAKRQARKR